MSSSRTDADIRKEVRKRYGKLAAEFEPQKGSSCCGTSSGGCQPIRLYETDDVMGLPEDVTGLSLGCGDPITLAALEPGQVVLDLGSGGGIDCFLAAQRVGESGHVIGVDMTPEMLDQARRNQAKMGFKNVEFRLGEIEHLPVEDNRVDVIISNCVINLSPDKPQVFREAFRALKPGGKLAVSDIMTDGPFPETFQKNMEAWSACVSGAWEEKDYLAGLKAAGFVDIKVERVSIETGVDEISLDKEQMPRVFSGKVSAYKPAG